MKGMRRMRKTERVINESHVNMMRGKRFSPKEIQNYENAVEQRSHDDSMEMSMMLFAEVLKEEFGFGRQRINKTLRKFDTKCAEIIEKNLEIDDLRVRCFEKTKIAFALNKEDQEHVQRILQDAGYQVQEL